MTRAFMWSMAVLALVAACRPGEGQRCVCAGECRRALVCAQGGRVLENKECIDPGDDTPGECIEQDNLPDMEDDGSLLGDVYYHDLGGKRDFEPGQPVTEDDGTGAGTSDGTSTSTSTSTSSSSSSGASSGSTGAP